MRIINSRWSLVEFVYKNKKYNSFSKTEDKKTKWEWHWRKDSEWTCRERSDTKEIFVVDVDLAYTQDGTGPWLSGRSRKWGFRKFVTLREPFLFDHALQARDLSWAMTTLFWEVLLKGQGSGFWCRQGISHQIAAETYVRPGDVVIGADSQPAQRALGPLLPGRFNGCSGCNRFRQSMV